MHGLAQMEKGTVCWPLAVLNQPQGWRGDFQLPVLLSLTQSSWLGACCWDSLRCGGGTAGWLGYQRLDLGLLLLIAAAEGFFRVHLSKFKQVLVSDYQLACPN